MDSKALFQKKKRNLYLSYDHHRDGKRFEEFQRLFSSLYEISRDISLARELGTEDSQGHVRHLAGEAMSGAGCAVVLCGAWTHLDKFVDWEIKVALDGALGLLGIVLPENPAGPGGDPILPDRMRRNFDSGFAVLCRWEELAKDRIDLSQRIDFAVNRPPDLIDNTLPLRSGQG